MREFIFTFALFLSMFSFAGHDQIEFGMDYDLMKVPMQGYTQWCFINFEKDHWDLDKEQTPKDFSRVMVKIPEGATAVQITGKSPRKCFCNEGAEMALIPGQPSFNGSHTQLRFQVQYWGDPFKVFIGWKFDGNVTKRGRVTQCRAVIHDGSLEEEWFDIVE